ncbi:hypothetical protein CRG98_025853 [Punica granatum]|uniref:Uncharacterized protein n=1 Tax=Punica granatum TaxID=22663 RepID=A0A2I0JCG9_PUNGR|nr:hypothetical protein CRG98_025853 [Punica granatum]
MFTFPRDVRRTHVRRESLLPIYDPEVESRNRFELRGGKRSGSSDLGFGPSSSRLSLPDYDGGFTVWTGPVIRVVLLISGTRKSTQLVPTLGPHTCRPGSLHKRMYKKLPYNMLSNNKYKLQQMDPNRLSLGQYSTPAHHEVGNIETNINETKSHESRRSGPTEPTGFRRTEWSLRKPWDRSSSWVIA